MIQPVIKGNVGLVMEFDWDEKSTYFPMRSIHLNFSVTGINHAHYSFEKGIVRWMEIRYSLRTVS
jgi:hypothetical protein